MDLEHRAIERLKIASEMSLNHYGEQLVCTYSGGKDSDVMLEHFLINPRSCLFKSSHVKKLTEGR
ncbi:hypothetical protein C806_00097 [Lachnospiraceae bacterium 3-1]|nr:hypothetical protein C806_00097 [Lachnospiraceae bacterium 3-1]